MGRFDDWKTASPDEFSDEPEAVQCELCGAWGPWNEECDECGGEMREPARGDNDGERDDDYLDRGDQCES
ncbi:MAG: hypothetical protein WC683_09960 [bacterium]